MKSMKDFARHIIKVANQYADGITNLQLQKVMYFSIKDFLNDHHQNSELIKSFYHEPFETWDYGPVVPIIFDTYRYYGNMIILDKGKYSSFFKPFDKYIKHNLKEDIFNLIEKSQKQPIWKKHQNQILDHQATYQYQIKDIILN